MPIRFRCPHCTRLLGIAKRKAGMQISCPQCTKLLTVPTDDGDADLDEIDVLLNPSPGSASMPTFSPRPDPPRPFPPAPLPPRLERPQVSSPSTAAPRPQSSTVASRPQPQEPNDDLFPLPEPTPLPRPQPQRKPAPNRESPLLENDVDALLGMKKPGTAFELDEDPTPRQKPVSGVDAFSLMEDEPGGLHLSPQKATLLAVAVVVLMGIAFAAGYLIASNT